MINLAQPCSGCGACLGICPKGAIRLKSNAMGFLEAAVDEGLCVDCGLCQRACPRLQPPETQSLYALEPLALQSADPAVLRESTSGGIAHELAKAALLRGEKAAGVVYDLQSNTARHKLLTDISQLPELAGSKYLQSSTEALREVLQLARQERLTVFGTPCQMAGLARAAELAGVREKLLLVELFCHGVPTGKLWQAQLEDMKKKLGTASFDALKFRDKAQGWHSYRLRATGGGKTYTGSRENTRFYLAYFEDLLLSPACMDCAARLSESAADIRLGDYWGKAFQSRTDGVSLVFAATAAGREAVQALLTAGAVRALPATDAREALKYQNMAPYPENPLHTQAMEALRRGERLDKALADCRRKQPLKKQLKHLALRTAGLLPPGLVEKLKQIRRK